MTKRTALGEPLLRLGRRTCFATTVSVTAALAVVVGMLPALPASGAGRGSSSGPRLFDIEKVSQTPDEAEGFEASGPVVSADGRYVAYTGESEAAASQVYVVDRATGVTTLVSRSTADPGSPADGDSHVESISADGRYIAFVSHAGDLDDGYPEWEDGPADAPFIADRVTGDVTVVPVPAFDDLPDQDFRGRIAGMSLSADGKTLAYAVQSVSAWNGTTMDYYDGHLIVRDLAARSDYEIAGLDDRTIGGFTLSGDGRWLAYYVGGLGMQLHDLTEHTDTPVGEDLYYITGAPSLSADGRLLAYYDHSDSYLFDQATDEITILESPSRSYGTSTPALSADGTTLVFADQPENGEGYASLYRVSLSDGEITGAPELVTADPDGEPSPSKELRTAVLTADGSQVVFDSDSPNLVPDPDDDPDLLSAIYAAHRLGIGAPSWPGGAALTADGITATSLMLHWPAATGPIVAYDLTRDGAAIASNLTAGTTSYLVTELSAATSYTFQISARNLAGSSSALEPPLVVSTAAGPGLPGTAPLSASAGSGGTATLRWDAAGDDMTGYRVMRGTDVDGALTAVADVDGTTTSYDDSGLGAETHYRYRIDTLRGETAEPYTVIAEIDTPAITISSLDYAVTLVDRNRAARLGSDLTIRLHGEANRHASAVVTFHTAADEDGSATIELAEASAGAYTGTFALAEDVARIDRIRGTVADGVGLQATMDAAALPLAVSAVVAVTVVAPGSGSVAGAKLTVVSAGGDSGNQQTIEGPGTYSLSVLAADDYAVRLTIADGSIVAQTTGVHAQAGVVRPVSITPVLPASLTVVKDIGEVSNNPYALTVTDVTTGLVLAAKTMSTTTTDETVTFDHLPADTTVRVDAELLSPASRVVAHRTVTAPLVAGANTVTFTQQPLPHGTLSGTITVKGSTLPAALAQVAVTQQIDGRSFSSTTTADLAGHYSIDALAGPATVAVTRWDIVPQTATTTVAESGTTVDIAVPGVTDYLLHLHLLTTPAGGVEVEQAVDWTVGAHFRLTIGAEGYGQRLSGSQVTGLVPMSLLPGTGVTLCGDGREAGLSAGCTTVTVADDQDVDITLRLASAGTISGRINGIDGHPSARRWSIAVDRLEGDGKVVSEGSFQGAGNAFSVGVASPGLHRITVVGGYAASPIEVDVLPGGNADVGVVQLRGNNVQFSGPDNSVAAVRGEVVSGGVATFRTSYKNTSGSTLRGATIRLAVPGSTTLVTGSLVKDGQPVAAPKATGRYVEVPLGDLAPGASGTLYHSLQLAADAPAGALSVDAWIGYGTYEVALGSAFATVVGVSLNAPQRSKTARVTVSGHAPALATVEVTEDGLLLAQATATAGGLWQAELVLADKGPGWVHQLQATSTTGSTTVRSPLAFVTVDAKLMLADKITMVSGGRQVEFNPDSGVATFPFVFRSDQPITLTASYPTDAGTITDPVAQIGSAFKAATCAGRICTATLTLKADEVGQVFFSYTSTRPFDPSDLTSVRTSSEDELRGRLRGPLAQFANARGEAHPEDTSGTVTVDVPALGPEATLTSTLTVRHHIENYVPTPEDEEVQQLTGGLPIYGLTRHFADGFDGKSIELTFYLPESLVSGEPPAGSASRSAGLAAAGSVGELAMFTLKTAGYGKDGLGIFNSALDNLSGADTFSRLSDILDSVSGCSPDVVRDATSWAQGIADSQWAAIAVSGSLSIIGVVLAPATFGASLLVAGVGLGMDLTLNAMISSSVDDLAKYVAQQDCSNVKGGLVADPTWIYDPSGYTYEAVAANRLPA